MKINSSPKIIEMKTDETLQKDVQEAIKWEPLLKVAEIGVIAKDGIITLTGIVDSYFKKVEAEEAAKNVAGVKAVVEKIEIKFSDRWSIIDDNEIANEVLNALKRNWSFSIDSVKVKVEHGWVTLEGELAWNYQSEDAKKSIIHLIGVTGISNNIKIKSETHDEIEKKDIESAISRNWSIIDRDIHVKVSGTKVTLTGTVSSSYQKKEAGRMAWNAPGVWTVYNELIVDYDYSLFN